MSKIRAILTCGLVAGLLVCGNLLAREKKDSGKPSPLAEAVKTKRVDVNFEATPLADVVSFLKTLVEINIVIDPNIKDAETGKKLVTLSLTDVSLGTALDIIVGKNLTYLVKDDFIVITDRDKQPSQTEAKPPTEEEVNLQTALKTREVDVNFEATPLSDVVNFLKKVTETNITLDPDIVDPEIRQKLITLSLKGVKLSSVLDLLVGDKLMYVIKGNVVVITEKPGK